MLGFIVKYRNILLPCLASIAVGLGVWNYQANKYENKISSLKAEYATKAKEAEEAFNKQITEINTNLAKTTEQLNSKTLELNNEIKNRSNTIQRGIANGTIRLRDKGANACQAAARHTGGSSGSSAGHSDYQQGSGHELSRQTSEALVRLATDADEANIALKACIQQYNQIRQQFMQK